MRREKISYFCDNCRKPKPARDLTHVQFHMGGSEDPSLIALDEVCGDCRAAISKFVAAWLKGDDVHVKGVKRGEILAED